MARKINKEEKFLYKALLPKKVNVKIHKAEEGGFWVEVKEFPGLRTQGDSLSELIEMINDAIYGYLGIPSRAGPTETRRISC